MVLTKQSILKMTTAYTDSPKVGIRKRFKSNNILHNLQELVGITNKTAMQWYEYYRDICTAKIPKNRSQLGSLWQEISADRTEFIVWCLRRPIMGMPTGSRSFSLSAHDFRFVRGPHHKTALCHNLTLWNVRQILSKEYSVSRKSNVEKLISFTLKI